MTERQFFGHNSKALRLDYGSLKANADDVGLFCMSRSSWMLARNLVGFYGGWRSRYVEDITAAQLRGVTDDEWSDLQQWYERAQAELEGDMSCDFTTALEQINLTLQGIGFNINVAGGACCSPVEGLPPVAEPQLGNPAIDDPPAGFDTWAEYDTYKCKAANRIADDWIETLDNMGTLGGALGVISGVALAAFLNTSLLSGVLVGLMAIGFSAFTAAAVIIAALVTLALSGVGLFAYFAAVSGELDTIKADLVCDLYNAQTVENAYNAVVASTENAVDNVVFSGNDADIFSPVISEVTDGLFNPALLNILFINDEATGEYVGTVDCGACVPCAETDLAWVAIKGTGTVADGEIITAVLNEPDVPNDYRVVLGGTPANPTYVGSTSPKLISMTGLSGFSPTGSQAYYVGGYDFIECEPVLITASGTVNPWDSAAETCCTHISLVSSTPFTVTLNVHAEPCTLA